MKLSAFLLFALCMQVSARGVGQSISLSFKDAPLLSVINEIRTQSGYSFFYQNRLLTGTKLVTIQGKNLSISQALDLAFKDQPLSYLISGKTITIAEKVQQDNAPPSPSSAATRYQKKSVKGRITNTKGEPVVDATVMIDGTGRKTATNGNGEFSFQDIDDNATLTISHVQYEPETITVDGRNNLTIVLTLKVNTLDEYQVIAYGTVTRKLNTGSVSTVKSTDIEKQPVQNPLLAMQGRVAGMTITQSSGVAGAGVKVQIRGRNSMLNGTDPLYIVDGVPYASQLLSSLSTIQGSNGATGNNSGQVAGNPLSYINPSDIESISVLKDADATAIYGSRGANGVVIITTKKGKAGRLKVDLNAQNGWGKVTRYADLMNTQQYIQMRKEAIANNGINIDPNSDYDLTVWDTTRYTNWQKQLIGNTAKYSEIATSISGGNENFQYLVGGGYYRQTTVFPGDFSDKKASTHFNLSANSNNKRISFTLSGNYVYDNNVLPLVDFTAAAVTLAPDAPTLKNEDGTLNFAYNSAGKTTWDNGNPLAYLYRTFTIQTYNLVTNASIKYEIWNGISAKVNAGYTNLQANQTSLYPFIAVPPYLWKNSNRSSNFSNNNINSWIIEPQLNYSKHINKGIINVLLGSTIQQQTSLGQSLNASGFTSDLLLKNLSAANTVNGNTIYKQYKYNAGFARINFNWDDKYLVNFSGRRDGSSRFGAENRFQNFGAVGAAWVFSNEKLLQNNLSFLSYGKIRGSYGSTGNDQIGDYSFINLYNPASFDVNYQGVTGLRVGSLYNPNLQWELTKKLEGGIELGFFKDLIFLSTNVYRNRSSNQLLNYTLPSITGFTSVTTNFPATVQNSGWEFELAVTPIKTRDFSWKSSFNLTLPKNKLLAFPGIEKSPYSTLFFIGKSLNVKGLYRFMGVNDTTGLYQFAGTDGKPTYGTPQMNAAFVDLSQKYYGGFQNTLIYKGFQLDFIFQFVKQLGTNYKYGNYPGSPFNNQPTVVLNRWQKPGDITDIQKYDADYSLSNQIDYVKSSDAAYTDASFVRLKNVSLSWSIPRELTDKIKVHNVRVYCHAQNLFTITHFKGMDPENMSVTSLPPLKIVTVGIQASF